MEKMLNDIQPWRALMAAIINKAIQDYQNCCALRWGHGGGIDKGNGIKGSDKAKYRAAMGHKMEIDSWLRSKRPLGAASLCDGIDLDYYQLRAKMASIYRGSKLWKLAKKVEAKE